MLILFQPDYEPSLIEYPSQRLKFVRRALTANENRERKKKKAFAAPPMVLNGGQTN